MPCDTIQTTTIEWSEKTDLEALHAALLMSGFEVALTETGLKARHKRTWDVITFESATGTLRVVSTGRWTGGAALKREYSQQIVQKAAQRFGWTLKDKNSNRLQAVKRY
jgi:hypothetical protein